MGMYSGAHRKYNACACDLKAMRMGLLNQSVFLVKNISFRSK